MRTSPWRGAAAALLLVCLVPVAGILPAGAQTVDVDALIRAATEVAERGAEASGHALALTYQNNRLIHLLASGEAPRIPDHVFQANQRNFLRMFEEYSRPPPGSGIRVTFQEIDPSKLIDGQPPPFTTGTDVDAVVSSTDPTRQLTARDVARIRGMHHERAAAFARQHGVPAAGAPNADTSFLPDPGSMTETEWREAIMDALAAGEDAIYQCPLAAAAEAKMRLGQSVSVAEATARAQEVARLADESFAAANRIDAAARTMTDPIQRQAMEAQAQFLRHNGAKYINRIQESGEYIAQQHHLTPESSPSGIMEAAAKRGVETAREAAAAGAMAQHFTARATQSFVQNLSEVARTSGDPVVVAQAQRGMAQALNRLAPAQQGEALEGLRRANPQLARNVAENMRGMPKPKPPFAQAPESSGKLARAAKHAGTALALYQGYSRLRAVYDARDPAEQFMALPQEQQEELLAQMTPTQRRALDLALERLDDPVYQEELRRSGFDVFTPAQSHEAGRQLGGFIGGTAGAKSVGWLWATSGGAIGTAVAGPVGGAVGAIAGGIMGGMIGYARGSAVGTEMGDTQSQYWDQNKSDAEFNRIAIATGGMNPEEVYRRLRAKGVDDQRARIAADTYRNGALGLFNQQVRVLHEELTVGRAAAERAAENRRRVEEHRAAQEFFEDAWARTERQEREHESRVEASYDEWADYLAGLPPEERRQAAVQAGVTDEQLAELERRIAERPDAAQVTPGTVPPGPVPDDVETPPIGAVYGQTVSLDMGGGIRAAAPAPVPTPAAPVRQPDRGMSYWRAVWSRYELLDHSLAMTLARIGRDTPSDEDARYIAETREQMARMEQELRQAPPEVLKELNAPATWTTEQDPFDTAGDPVAQDPDAGFMGDPSAPTASRYRFVYQSTPTLTFDPPESGDGRTRVTFERMGEIKLWAQVEETVDGATRRYETAIVIVNVSAPALSLDFSPADGPVGEEVRVRVRTDPAVPDGLINYVWHSPASSQRRHYAANAGDIGVVPRSADPVGFRVEARVPVHGDVIGQASGTYQPAQPEEIPDAPSAEARAQQLINEGYGLEQQKDLAGAIDKYEQAQRLVANAGLARRITDLQAELGKQQRAQQLINEGYALEQRRELPGAIDKYEQAQRLVANDGLARRIADLRARLAREQEEQRRAREVAIAEQQRQTEAQQRATAEREAREQATREQAAREQRAREQAAREQAAREQRAREQAESARQAELRRAEEQRRQQAEATQQAEARRAEEQRRQQAEAQRQAEARRAEEQRRQQAEATRQAEARRRAEEEARRQQQQQAQQNRFSGTFELRGNGREAMRWTLRQDGNTVTGTLQIIWEGGSDSEPFRGTVRGNRLDSDSFDGGAHMTISTDNNTITLHAGGETHAVRRIR